MQANYETMMLIARANLLHLICNHQWFRIKTDIETLMLGCTKYYFIGNIYWSMVLEVAQWKCRSVATVTRTIISPIALSALLIYPQFCYTDSLVNRKANRKYSLTINTGFRIGCSYARYLISTAARLLTRIEIYASYNINIREI